MDLIHRKMTISVTVVRFRIVRIAFQTIIFVINVPQLTIFTNTSVIIQLDVQTKPILILRLNPTNAVVSTYTCTHIYIEI